MSFLRKLAEGQSPPAGAAPAAAGGAWKSGEFARASGHGVEVRFHDAAEAGLAAEQLRELMAEWQSQVLELAAAYAEENAKHAGIVNEMKARQGNLERVIRQIDGAIAQVEAYVRRDR